MNTVQSAKKTNLQVGLLIDSFIQPRWIHSIIESLKSTSFAHITLVIKNESCIAIQPARTVKGFRFKNYWLNRKYLLYACYNRYDEMKTWVETDAFEPLSIEELVFGCPVLSVQPLMDKYSDRFKEEDIDQIRSYDLDVVLRFGFRILRGPVLQIAKHGIWSYHHGDNLVNRGGPAGFWEVFEGNPITGSILQVLTHELDNGKVLCRSWAPTADRFSVRANRNNLYWKSAAFVPNKLKELYDNGDVSFDTSVAYPAYSNRLYRMPTNREMLPSLLRLFARYTRSKIKHTFYFNQWSLAYRFKSNPSDTNTTFYRYKYLLPPKDRFWADPFPVKVDGKYFIFFEEYIYETEKAHISVVEIDQSGTVGQPNTALNLPYHLSYPYLFQWQGVYFMVPETSSNRTVELFRCTTFPDKWELEKILLKEVSATDATLVEINDVWWMFVNISSPGVTCGWDELHLYYSDRPNGEWTPHPRNPVKLDVRSSRPAGRLFFWNAGLYRPAQDCSNHYGYAITINRVLELTTSSFKEEEVSKILPRWRKDIGGTHTINSAEDLTVIDCLINRRR